MHRRAITGTVPDRVAWKRSKYMGERQAPHIHDTSDIVENMKRVDADLHPMLADMIDHEKWRTKIERIESGGCNEMEGIQVRRQTNSLKWLNIWLHGLSVA
ncbi:hypothetical protein SPHINGOR109_10001 [Sphingorhabdus sp. 109]|nr:hypothetical protein SPHINGOR109_10001 [Sphingorhabdus sp. 109]